MTMAYLFAICAVICQALALALLFALHFVQPRRSLSDAVSDYALGQTASLFLIYGLIGTAATLCLAVATDMTVAVSFPARVPAYLFLLGILRFGVLAFRTDLPGASITRTGRLHLLFAVVTFALAYMAIAAADSHLDGVGPQGLVAALHILRWIVAAGLIGVVIAFAGPLRPVFGYLERVFLAGSALWFLLLGVGLVISG